MTDQPVLFETSGSIATITLNLPKLRNPISEKSVVEALLGAFDRLAQDLSIKVAILTGAGSAFSAGGDVKAMAETMADRATAPIGTTHYYQHGIQRLPLALARIDVPIIAAVNGPAVGAGCDLACMCDIRIAGESARFAESFVKMGLIPGDGGAWLLQRAVGFSKAAEMALTGEPIDAREALACGLVSKVVADAELMPEAHKLAARIAANPGAALRMTKRLLWRAREMDLAPFLELCAQMQALAHTTPDHREAVTAFLEKRAPRFSER